MGIGKKHPAPDIFYITKNQYIQRKASDTKGEMPPATWRDDGGQTLDAHGAIA